jgi:hypothetical protein
MGGCQLRGRGLSPIGTCTLITCRGVYAFRKPRKHPRMKTPVIYIATELSRPDIRSPLFLVSTPHPLPIITAMDEASLRALCTSFSYYHTLEEKNASIHSEGGFHLQRKISTIRPTYVHFAVELDDHWAAVQITINPFAIRSIPDQAFYTCCYSYTLCCDSAIPSAICETVQRMYDVHYRPIQWDFSSKLW